MRLLVTGNSGAGKSTLARRLSRAHGLEHHDLDSIAWLPTVPPRRAPLTESAPKIAAMTGTRAWVIEGCYADLLALAAPHATLLVFCNPGIDACVANCRARPWEPHKYASREAQDANLPMLLAWVRDYEVRSDEFSLDAHRALFDRFAGAKRELTSLAETAAFTL